MIDHIGLAVSDIERSRAFYEAALKPLGYALVGEPMTNDIGGTVIMFGIDGEPDFVSPTGKGRARATTSPSAPRPGPKWTPSTRRPWRRVVATTGGRASGTAMARTTMRPSFMTPTVSTSRRCVTRLKPDLSSIPASVRCVPLNRYYLTLT